MKQPFTRKKETTEFRREVSYKVDGFWPISSVWVTTRKNLDKQWEDPEVRWIVGGQDGSTDSAEAAWNLSCAIRDAVKTARKWKSTL